MSEAVELKDDELEKVSGGAEAASWSRLDAGDVFKDIRFSHQYIVIKDTVNRPCDRPNEYLINYYEAETYTDKKIHVHMANVYHVTHALLVTYYKLVNETVYYDK